MHALAIVGPTASGKSALAMAVADRVPGTELVAVDAMQVYRGMDIGTAKPTAADRARVPHHLLDLVDPGEEVTVVRFRREADAVLSGIAGRGGHAVLVAGTGLYLRAVIDHLEPPGTWPAIRAELEAEAAARGPEPLYERLRALDPVAAARIEPGNTRRIVRALEVCLGAGCPFSSFGPGLDTYPPTDVAQVGLRWSRPVLARRIETRLHQMLADGLLGEVRRLAERPLSRTARQALGYKELLAHLDGLCSLDEAVHLAVTRTRQFAVRQERWFRRDPRIRWVDLHDDPLEAVAVVEAAVAACA